MVHTLATLTVLLRLLFVFLTPVVRPFLLVMRVSTLLSSQLLVFFLYRHH